MADRIRIDELNPTALPSREHVVPAMKDGQTVTLSVEQIVQQTEIGDIFGLPDALGSKVDAEALTTELSSKLDKTGGNVGDATAQAAFRTAVGAASGAAVTDISNQLLGQSQTWQDMSGSRAHSTSYQNTTGRPIVVNITWVTAAGVYLQVSANNSTWISVAQPSQQAGTPASVIVPNAWYYRLSGSIAVNVWAELR